MAKTLLKILELTWEQQADHLQGLSKKDLEILWFQLKGHGESFDQLNLAVYSILRDLYESQGQKRVGTQL